MLILDSIFVKDSLSSMAYCPFYHGCWKGHDRQDKEYAPWNSPLLRSHNPVGDKGIEPFVVHHGPLSPLQLPRCRRGAV